MKERLTDCYRKQLSSLFKDTKRHLAAKDFGADKVIIATTIPFMMLENWREYKHKNEVPLLGETVKNVIMAVATSIFGWNKTSFLHMRVSLESTLYGVNLLMDSKNYKEYLNTGVFPYKRFSDLIKEFVEYNALSRKVSKIFKLNDEMNDLYGDLSSWSHTLGDQFLLDLQVLGRRQLNPKSIKEIKDSLKRLSKCSVLVYLAITPSILSDLSHNEQQMLLQPMSLEERAKLRDAIGV